MKQSELIKRCAEIVPGWDIDKTGVCPPDGFGVFRFKKIENNFKGSGQMFEYWDKTYYPQLIDSTIETLNKMVLSFGLKMHICTFFNKISILGPDYGFLHTCRNDESGIGTKEKKELLIKYFELLDNQ